jgi:hypothetical protein
MDLGTAISVELILHLGSDKVSWHRVEGVGQSSVAVEENSEAILTPAISSGRAVRADPTCKRQNQLGHHHYYDC